MLNSNNTDEIWKTLEEILKELKRSAQNQNPNSIINPNHCEPLLIRLLENPHFLLLYLKTEPTLIFLLFENSNKAVPNRLNNALQYFTKTQQFKSLILGLMNKDLNRLLALFENFRFNEGSDQPSSFVKEGIDCLLSNSDLLEENSERLFRLLEQYNLSMLKLGNSTYSFLSSLADNDAERLLKVFENSDVSILKQFLIELSKTDENVESLLEKLAAENPKKFGELLEKCSSKSE